MADCFILKNNAKEKERQYTYGLTKEYSDFGNTEWVEILARDIDNFFMSENATIEVCFKVFSINSGTGADLGRVFEIADTGNNIFLGISLDDNLSKINFRINTWSDPAFSYRTEINKLYTITLKQTVSTTAIYINGEFFTSINKSIVTGRAFHKICLKGSIGTSNRLMQGRVYSLRLYNRALSEAEILYNYKIDNYGGENIKKTYSTFSENLFDLEKFKTILSNINTPIVNGNIEWLDNGFKLTSTKSDCYISHETNSYWIDIKPNTLYELTLNTIGNSRDLIFLTYPINASVAYEYYDTNKIIFSTLGNSSKILIRFGIWEAEESTIFQNIQLREKVINEEKLELDLTYKNYIYGIIKEYNDGGNNLDTIIISDLNDCFNVSKNMTVEINFSISTALNSDQSGYARLFEIANSGKQLFLGVGFMDDFTKISLLMPSGWKEYQPYNFDFNKKYTCTIVQTESKTKMYINGQLLFETDEIIEVGKALYEICLKGSINVAKRMFNGRIYSFRLYDKALMDNEILHNYYIDEQEGINAMCMEITEYERYLKSIMQVGVTQNASNLGHYTTYAYRNCIPIPQIYPRDILITADDGFELTYQFYKTNRTGIDNQLINGTWIKSFEVPANTYFCLIIRHANDNGTTKTLPDDSCHFTVTLK